MDLNIDNFKRSKSNKILTEEISKKNLDVLYKNRQEKINKYGVQINKIYNQDCLEGMKKIKDSCVDMILCDLPYGTTQCKWDSQIPLNDFIYIKSKDNKQQLLYKDEFFLFCYKNKVSITEANKQWNRDHNKGLWHHYNRVIKDTGVVVLTAVQPFSTILINSNVQFFKYNWVWKKNKATGHLNAKRQPLRSYEDIVVFYKKQCVYNPQGTVKGIFNSTRPAKGKQKGEVYGQQRNDYGHSSVGNYPRNIISFPVPHKPIHPTQKPTELFEYLIKTYTNKNDLVLDNCMGSGTTAISCINTNRKYLGYEMNEDYYDQSVERIRKSLL